MAEYRTPGGIIIPSSAVVEGKMDRSQGAAVRTMAPPGNYGISRFKEYSDYLTAVKVPWVYPCVRLISHTFAKNKWGLMNGSAAIKDPRNTFVQLMTRPNPRQSGYHFRLLFTLYMELLGEAFITLENRDGYGRPRELYLPNPAFMTVMPDPVNFVKGYLFRPMGMSPRDGIPYDPDEVIHIMYPNPNNPWRGLGTVEANAIILDIVEAVAFHEKSYYESGGRIIGVLETETEVSDADFEKIKLDWRAFSADKQQRLKTAILQSGLKYTPIAEGMKNIDVVDINREKRDAILGAWGVPKTKLGILEDAQYKLDDADITFRSETMDPKFQVFEEDIQPLVDLWNPAWSVEFERVNFESDTTKITNARGLAQTFSIDVNEIRDYLGYPPKKGGDVPLVPSQMMPMDVASMQDLSDANVEDATAPPEPPAPPAAPALPSPTTGDQTGNGAKPTVTPANESITKMLEVATPAERVVILADQKHRDYMAIRLESKMARDGKAETRPNQRLSVSYGTKSAGQKQVIKTSLRAPALGVVKIRRQERFIGTVREVSVGEIRRAFRSQQRAVTKRLADIVKPVNDPKRVREVVAERVGEAIPAGPMADVVGGLHASGLTAGFAAGQMVMDPRNRHIVAQRIAVKKDAHPEGKQVDYIPPDSPSWRTHVEEWRTQFPLLDSAMTDMGGKITGIDDTTRGRIVDQVVEGMRRGYSPLQIAEGYADEGYDGIAGVFENATDWRAEMIARTEARDAFERGSLASFAMGEVPAVEAVDGETFDEACRTRNGAVYPLLADGSIDAPSDELDEHPNGTLTWVPAALNIADTGDTGATRDLFGTEA